MIIMRELEKDDYLKVKYILKENGIEDDLSRGLIYAITDENDIMGVGKILTQDNYGILKYLVVKGKFRGFNYGDSILRGLLFKCQSMGINRVYYNKSNSYLLKKGFIYDEKIPYNDCKLYVDVNDFLNTPCCGDTNGI